VDLLEYERYIQQQRQRKAIELQHASKGVTRIGERIAETDRYEVLFPDGSKNPNGIKVFSAEHTIGDVVLPYPRPDGTIALDSNKGMSLARLPESPKRVEGPKGKVWIFYEHAGKIWIGGHQAVPVEIGTIAEFGNVWATYNSAEKPSLSVHLKCHIWANGDRWIAGYMDAFNGSTPLTGPRTLVRVENGVKKILPIEFDNADEPYVADWTDTMYSVFPLGGGLLHYVRRVGGSIVLTGQNPNSHAGSYAYRFSIWDGISNTFNDLTLNYSDQSLPPWPFADFVVNRQMAGTIPIPSASGSRSYGGQYAANNNTHGVQTAAFSSSIDYPILSDGTSCYWIREEVQSSGGGDIYPVRVGNNIYQSPGDSVTRKYTLYLGTTKIRTQDSPKFFGINWRLRPSGVPETNDEYLQAQDLMSPERSAWYFESGYNSVGEIPQPIVGITQNGQGYPPVINAQVETLYPNPVDGMPVNLVNGQVVGVPSDEIARVIHGGGTMRRVARSPDGQEYDLPPAYCYPIPSDALIYHWCCDAG
jgi:hypothetical protein